MPKVTWTHKGQIMTGKGKLRRTQFKGHIANMLPNNVAFVKATEFRWGNSWIATEGYYRVALHRLKEIE